MTVGEGGSVDEGRDAPQGNDGREERHRQEEAHHPGPLESNDRPDALGRPVSDLRLPRRDGIDGVTDEGCPDGVGGKDEHA